MLGTEGTELGGRQSQHCWLWALPHLALLLGGSGGGVGCWRCGAGLNAPSVSAIMVALHPCGQFASNIIKIVKCSDTVTVIFTLELVNCSD